MASKDSITVSTTSPKSGNGDVNSPKGQCLCSPTTHQGSFRCRFHRSTSNPWFKRSNSMPPKSATNNLTSLSPKSVEST
ncbi:hypothetical protein ACSBR2_005684 [Camellia fascicularis]